ncbi:MAG TPA: hypothetical protein VGB63_08515 [Pedobacter sp.]|jgi:hypothetical protein
MSAFTSRPDCGKVFIEQNHIIWEVDQKILIDLDISRIVTLGEYTTIHALHRNEWFIVFIYSEEETYQISAYAEGMQQALEKMSQFLSYEICVKLALKTDFCSNILWPQELAGSELYELRVIESKRFFDRFRARLGFGNPLELVLNSKLRELIQG